MINHISTHYLNFFHTITPHIHISVNNQLCLKGLAHEQITTYHSFQSGIHQVEISQGEETHSFLLPLIAHRYYTLFITDSFQCFLVANDSRIHKNESNIRFVNIFSPLSPIDIAVTGGDVLFPKVLFQSVTDFLSLTPMTIDLEIRLPGTKQVLMALPKITCTPDHSHTIVITPSSYQNIASSMKRGSGLLKPS